MLRFLKSAPALSAIVAASVAVACSSGSPEEPSSAVTHQALACESVGGCPTPTGTPVPPHPPLPLCHTTPGCSVKAPNPTQSLVPLYRPGDAGVPGNLQTDACQGDGAFFMQLSACTAPQIYVEPGVEVGGPNQFFFSWCPEAPVDSLTTWEVLDSCDDCTGPAPHVGWQLIAWVNAWCGEQPGGGCHSLNCITGP